MGLGWAGLIPLSMYNVVVTAFGILIGKPFTAGIVGVVLLIGGLLIHDQLFVKKKIA
jgi:hypothetical protein